MIIEVVIAVLAYLMGSLSSAIIVCRIAGLPDPRTEGSRNPGATNVLRYGGKKLAAIVLLGDILKGMVPVLAARLLHLPAEMLALVGLLAFAGHLYPVFFGFRGGKGVATALGVLMGLNGLLGLILIAIWLAAALISRISSLGAITAAIAAPFVMWWLQPVPKLVGAVALMSLVLLVRHQRNIRNLLHGTEPKIGKKQESETSRTERGEQK